jgi:hypothetical protein
MPRAFLPSPPPHCNSDSINAATKWLIEFTSDLSALIVTGNLGQRVLTEIAGVFKSLGQEILLAGNLLADFSNLDFSKMTDHWRTGGDKVNATLRDMNIDIDLSSREAPTSGLAGAPAILRRWVGSGLAPDRHTSSPGGKISSISFVLDLCRPAAGEPQGLACAQVHQSNPDYAKNDCEQQRKRQEHHRAP